MSFFTTLVVLYLFLVVGGTLYRDRLSEWSEALDSTDVKWKKASSLVLDGILATYYYTVWVPASWIVGVN